MYSVLTSGSGPDGAFGYVDHKVLIPGNLILSIATLGSALVVVWAGWTGQGRLAGAAILGIMVLALLTREVAPFIGEHIAEEQDPQRREMPYQNARVAYSRRAYATDAVRPRRQLDARSPNLAELSRNVAIWDAPAISRALETTTRADVGSLGWHGSPSGIVADVPERPPRAGSDTTRATFGLSRVLAWEVDEHGGLVHAPPAHAARGRDATGQRGCLSRCARLPDRLRFARAHRRRTDRERRLRDSLMP